MRLGVLDVGSNTVHLLVVDAHHGARPWPYHSEKAVLRLAERIEPDGALSRDGADGLVEAVAGARTAATALGAEELPAFPTSAGRDATNGPAGLDRVRDETGVTLRTLAGDDEARLTFLAVRRWFGWSAGTLLVLDIGGGSLELAAGADEDPQVACSVPLGAGRMTRDRLKLDPASTEPPADGTIEALREHVAATLEPAAQRLRPVGWDLPVASSKTFRTLARLAGAAPVSRGHRVRRELTRTGLRQVIGFIRHIPPAKLVELAGVSAGRAHQLLAGAVVAEETMNRLDLEQVVISPWALREGIILRHLAHLGNGA